MGSDLRGDDAAGILVARRLMATLARWPVRVPVTALEGGTAPENLTGVVRSLVPSHVILVDAAWLDRLPGTVALVPPPMAGGVLSCTHALPVALMAMYLCREIGAGIVIVGIQPRDISFGAPRSPEVAAAVSEVASAIRGALT
ncbi:MAG: hydrogenase maturation protease [Deltaproteobacteria bacterium]|nr:hydrogenase maturation protease [Deltaproteobacteria bacterium]